MLILAVGCALAGIALAWYEYGRKNAKQEGFLSRMKPIETLFANRWYMDHGYRKLLDYAVYTGFTNLFTRNDRRIIDGAIDGLAKFTVSLGRVFANLQNGLLQYNLYLTFFVIALMGLYFLLV